MENWGLVTYRKRNLLHSSSHDISSMAKVETIAHELAHQWFGNLVTLKCWGQVWLKESFATYFSLVAIDDVMANGLFEIEFTKNHRDIVQYSGRRALNSECVWDHARVKSLFDSTSYIRGGPILRMTQYFLGFEDLKKTMFYILSEHTFGNFDSGDLISAFQKSAGTRALPEDISLKDVMSSWLDEPGVPLVEVSRMLGTGTATFRQEPFHAKSGVDKQCWWIPITLTSLYDLNNWDLNTKIWMTCPREEVQIDGLDASEWLLVNVKMSGLYVVKYDEANWNLLSNTLKHESFFERIPSIHRFQLVFDRLLLASYGKVSYDTLLDTLLYLKHEKQYTPWTPAVDFFIKLKQWLYDEPELVGMYIRNLTQPHYSVNMTTININSVVEMNYRVLMARTACDFNLSECLRDMFDLYKVYKKASIEDNPIPKEFRPIVYCLVLERGSEADVDVFLRNFEEILSRRIYDPDEYHTMRNSFSCMRNREAASRSALFSQHLHDSEEVPIFRYNKDEESIYRKMEDRDPHLIAKWLPGFADQLYRTKDLKLFENFVARNRKKLSIYQDTVEDSMRKIKNNIEWKILHAEDVKRTLRRILNINEYNESRPEEIPSVVAFPMEKSISSGKMGTVCIYIHLYWFFIL